MTEPRSFDPESVEVLLFDIGGVVIDVDFGRCMASWAESAGVDVVEISSRFTFDSAYEEHERGNLAIDGYLDSLRRSLGVDLTDTQLLHGWNDIYLGCNQEVVELLRLAEDRFGLYAFTNSNPTHRAVCEARFGSELDVFTRVFSSFRIGHRKPDREAFEHVVAAIGVSPSSVLFFDDSIENVDGAIGAGLQAVHVATPESVRASLDQLGI